MIYYRYELYKDDKFFQCGQTTNKKYILNLIKYKRKSKRYKLTVVKFKKVIYEELDEIHWISLGTIYKTKLNR